MTEFTSPGGHLENLGNLASDIGKMVLIRGGDLFMFVKGGGNTGPQYGYVYNNGNG
jgi:hypothetical protein